MLIESLNRLKHVEGRSDSQKYRTVDLKSAN